MSTPGVVFQTSSFLYGVTYEMRHAAEGHGLVFAGTSNGFIYTFTSSLWYGLGPPLAILFAAAVVCALWKRDRAALMILAFAVPYYILISVSQVRFARYALPLFPAVALLCGWLVREVWLAASTRWRRWAWAGLCILAAISTFIYTLALDSLFGKPDPRDLAARWIFANVSEGRTIGLIDVPWFYTPPLSKDLGIASLLNRPDTSEEFAEVVDGTPYKLTIFSQSERPGVWWTVGRPPSWVIVSSYETDDALRLRDNDTISEAQRKQVRRVNADLDLITGHYVVRRRFGDTLSLNLPHDMRYVDPSITIYELRQ